MSAEDRIPDSLADRAAAADRMIAAFGRLLEVVDKGSERAEMPAVRRGSLLSDALSRIVGTLAGHSWSASTIRVSAVVETLESTVTAIEEHAANLAKLDRKATD